MGKIEYARLLSSHLLTAGAGASDMWLVSTFPHPTPAQAVLMLVLVGLVCRGALTIFGKLRGGRGDRRL